jgi:hypothetical protein
MFLDRGDYYRSAKKSLLPPTLEDFFLSDWPAKGLVFATRAAGRVGVLQVPFRVGEGWGLRHNGAVQIRTSVDELGRFVPIYSSAQTCPALHDLWAAVDDPVTLTGLLRANRRDRLADRDTATTGIMYGAADTGGWLALAFDRPMHEYAK